MPNKKIFGTSVVSKVKPANTLNEAGGRAYKMSDEAALAQYVVTSCFNKTFYASAEDQVDKIKTFANGCHNEFLAKVAVYGHEVAGMKDTPSYILALLSARGKADLEASLLFEKIFPRVVTNGKMLFNFVQMIRSGATGRRSFGTVAKRAIRKWFESKTGNQLFTSSIGANPSMADVIKMTHPKPESEEKKNLYAYLIGREYSLESLPPKVRDFEEFKQRRALGLRLSDHSNSESHMIVPVPDVPFQMLTALNLTKEEWVQVILNMPWNALRMNLNTAARHGVFDVKGVTEKVTEKLANPELVRKFNVFPYQLLSAYINTEGVPTQVRNALQDAMEVATENVPSFDVNVAVAIDTSGSMGGAAITGYRKGSTSKVTCVQVAALFGATIARRNKNTIILPFDTRVHDAKSINERDSIMTNAEKLARFGGGGTDSASALRVLNGLVGNRPELIVYVSDNMSWFNQQGFSTYGWGRVRGTGMAEEWLKYKKKTPKAKLVCIDIVPNDSVQVEDMPDVLNIGGANDKVWPAIENFVKNNQGDFVGLVNAVEI